MVAKRIGVNRNRVYPSVRRLSDLGLLITYARTQKCGIHENYRAANGYRLAKLHCKFTMLDYRIFS
ncbi:MAG TPA: hypothetical protein DEQ02_06990, partial [Ruminococcaceae bacterium]|nr:hypothetical protein [Oscillospiraceae bacterium]